MSKLQPREKVLLIVLGILLIIAVFVMMVLLPKLDEKKLLTNEGKISLIKLNDREVYLDTLIEQVGSLDEDGISDNDLDKIKNYAGEFFPNVNQDDTLMLLERFIPVEAYIDESFFIGNVVFEERVNEITPTDTSEQYNNQQYNKVVNNIVNFEFVGKYSVIEEFIKNIKNYQYPIYINGLHIETFDPANPEPVIDMNAEDPYSEVFVEYLDNGFRYRTANEDFVKGTIVLDFLELPILADYDDTVISEQLFASKDVEKNTNPFLPFQGFFTPTVIDKEEVETDIVVGEFDVPRETYIYKNLYNFENSYFFFVGKPVKEVSGKTNLSNYASKGNFSLGLEYNFAKSFNENTAYAVAEGESIALNESTYGLTMDVYSDSTNGNTFGLIIRDKNGIETEVPVVVGFNDTGWKEYSVELPSTINFPCYIQRFYVTDNNEKTALSGNINVDNIRGVYLNTEE